MSYRKKQTQVVAASKAGISERTARRIESGNLQTNKPPRTYRTRKDPLDGDFELHLVPLLEADPELQPITLLEQLNTLLPTKYDRTILRTLQRRVRKWRLLHGPDKEVMFRQTHQPGVLGLCDYTWMDKLNITIHSKVFSHKLFHYRLIFSGWTYVQVVFGGESFESLSSGLQNAFWRSGGVPESIRTDSLSAAFNNHYEKATLTERFDKLCRFYQVKPTRNNKGLAHENGGIESPHRHLKQKIDQQLRLRGHRDFKDISEYQTFIESIVYKINRQANTRFAEERRHLATLPKQKTHSYSEVYVRVTSSSTIDVRRVTYTVPSRLIGCSILVHVYDGKLVGFVGHQEAFSITRIYAPRAQRRRAIDYKHIIHSLAKKPRAFKYSKIRDDIIPQGDFTLIWKKLTQEHVSDETCHYMVDLLLLAKNYDCESALGRYVLASIEQDRPATIKECRHQFATASISIPTIHTCQHKLSDYNCLMEA